MGPCTTNWLAPQLHTSAVIICHPPAPPCFVQAPCPPPSYPPSLPPKNTLSPATHPPSPHLLPEAGLCVRLERLARAALGARLPAAAFQQRGDGCAEFSQGPPQPVQLPSLPLVLLLVVCALLLQLQRARLSMSQAPLSDSQALNESGSSVRLSGSQ